MKLTKKRRWRRKNCMEEGDVIGKASAASWDRNKLGLRGTYQQLKPAADH